MKKLLATLALLGLLAPLALARDCDLPFVDINNHWGFYNIENLYCRSVVQGRSLYYFEPDQSVTRAEFLKMALLNADIDPLDYQNESEPYGDVNKADWHQNHVRAGYALEVIHFNSHFHPDDTINRAEAITMLMRLADVNTEPVDSTFDDVPLDTWYTVYVRAAQNLSVIDGYPDDTFRPSNPVTRAEAAAMMDRLHQTWYEKN